MKATRIAKAIAVLGSALALSAALTGVAAAGDTDGGEPGVSITSTGVTVARAAKVLPAASIPAAEFSGREAD